MQKIAILAQLTAKCGREKEVSEVLAEVLISSRKEEGCLQYDVHCSLENGNSFMIYEVWTNTEAIETHSNTAHYLNYRKKIEPLVESRNVKKWSIL